MDFAERMEILEADPRIGKVKERRTTCFHVPGPKPPVPPADRLRHYLVNQRDFLPDRYEGHGLTPEGVIAEITGGFLHFDDSAEPCDQVIWEGDLVVAVVHSRGDKSGDVTRIEWPDAEAEDAAPDVAPPAAAPPSLPADLEWAAKIAVKTVGEDEAIQRLLLTGKYKPAPSAAQERLDARQRERFHVVHREFGLHARSMAETTLDELIADEIAEKPDEDLAIWAGDRLAAIIQVMPDGSAVPTLLPPEDSP